MSLNFVTGAVVENNEEKQLKADNSKEEVVQEEYDPRTLYERLQEQKLLKEEKFAQESRFSNHIKRIDEDEAEYFKVLAEEKERVESQRKLKEQLELEEFRQAQSSITVPAPAVLPTAVSAAIQTSDKAKVAKSNQKPTAPRKNSLAKAGAVIVKKRKQENEDDKDKSTMKKSPKSKHLESDTEPSKKKAKTDIATSKGTDADTKKTSANSLSLIAAYDDGSSSSDDEA